MHTYTHLPQDGYIQATAGPWAGYELSVTRALGHKNLEAYGVVAKPHVAMLKLEQKHTCLGCSFKTQCKRSCPQAQNNLPCRNVMPGTHVCLPGGGMAYVACNIWARAEQGHQAEVILDVLRASCPVACHGSDCRQYAVCLGSLRLLCVLASDGVWDVMQPDEVVHMVMECCDKGQSASAAAQGLSKTGRKRSRCNCWAKGPSIYHGPQALFQTHFSGLGRRLDKANACTNAHAGAGAACCAAGDVLPSAAGQHQRRRGVLLGGHASCVRLATFVCRHYVDAMYVTRPPQNSWSVLHAFTDVVG
eukprot:scaffold20961_cov24-Tisochrysis_lutea.AAC.3